MSKVNCVIYPLLLTLALTCNCTAGMLAMPHFESKEKKEILEKEALKGSDDAAGKVAAVYLLEFSNDALYWSLITAENGNIVGAYNVGAVLIDFVPDVNEPYPYGNYREERAWFWLKKAAGGGDKLAKDLIKAHFTKPEIMRLHPEAEIKHWHLTKDTVSKFKRAAMLGSPDAAFKLYEYYKRKEGLFWATIAAQNGHPKAPFIVGSLMLKSNVKNDKERAIFWLKKASEAGDKEAKDILDKASHLNEYR